MKTLSLPKVTNTAQIEPHKEAGKPRDNKAKNKNKAIEQLSAKLDTLTEVVESVTATKTLEQTCQCTHTKHKPKLNAKQYGCPECVKRGTSSALHVGRQATGQWDVSNGVKQGTLTSHPLIPTH